jgi:hypothetical protein
VSAVDELGAGLVRQLRFYLEHGWADDEVLDALDRQAARPATAPRFPMGGSPGRARMPLRKRRAIEAALGELRGGTSSLAAEDGIDRLRRALRSWDGEWPPTQSAIAEAAGWADQRSVRAACTRAGTTWPAEIEAADRNRGG